MGRIFILWTVWPGLAGRTAICGAAAETSEGTSPAAY
jgi:hypothetical protein